MKLIRKQMLLIVLTILQLNSLHAQVKKTGPVRVVVVGITHGHVSWILGRAAKNDIELVGIYEPNKLIAEKNAKKYHLPASLFYNNLAAVLDQKNPEAVLAFGSIKEHLMAVKAAAPRGIHIMVEKPLAANLADAL